MSARKAKNRQRRPKMRRTQPDRRASGALGDASLITRSVENMYRIVEPWQRQGEEVARRFSQAYGSIEIPESSRDVHGRFLHSGGGLLASWVELLAFYSDWLAGAGQVAPRGARRGLSPDLSSSASVAFEVKSARTVVVHADLDAGAEPEDLTVPGIRRKSGVRIRFSSRGGQVTAQIRVQESARPGRYVSEIVDDYTDEAVGHVSIQVR